MYEETKRVLRKALEITSKLYFLGNRKYIQLSKATADIRYPSKRELDEHTNKGLELEDAMILVLREKYKGAALSVGLKEEHGLAMLEYAAMIEELKE